MEIPVSHVEIGHELLRKPRVGRKAMPDLVDCESVSNRRGSLCPYTFSGPNQRNIHGQLGTTTIIALLVVCIVVHEMEGCFISGRWRITTGLPPRQTTGKFR